MDEIVAELAADERIRKLYDLWYEQREDVLRTYTDHFPERVPLEQNKEFKTIRNAVIQEAMKIVSGIQQAAELEPQQDVWEVDLPSGEEPDMEAMADPSYWTAQFQPKFTEVEPVISETDPVDVEPEDAPTLRSSNSKEWWSDYYKLARKYLYGTKERKPDYSKAWPILLLEANRGNGYACYDLGRMYLLGQGCDEDEEEAQRWFRDALEAFQTAEMAAEKKGYLRYRIGKCHAYGHGAEQNYEESAKWFRQAVDENNPFAAYSWLDSTSGGRVLNGAMRRPTVSTIWRQPMRNSLMPMPNTSSERCTGMGSVRRSIRRNPDCGTPKPVGASWPWKRTWRTTACTTV